MTHERDPGPPLCAERRVLVAGLGNVLFGDDGFGVEVARRLARGPLAARDAVRVMDVGIRGMDLAFELLDARYDATILIDATPRGGAPGTLYVLAVDPDDAPGPTAPGDVLGAHDLTPARVLAMVRAMGGAPRAVRVVGCEPAVLGARDDDGDDDENALVMGLSAPVQAAVERAAALVESLVDEALARPPATRARHEEDGRDA